MFYKSILSEEYCNDVNKLKMMKKNSQKIIQIINSSSFINKYIEDTYEGFVFRIMVHFITGFTSGFLSNFIDFYVIKGIKFTGINYKKFRKYFKVEVK